MPEVSEAANKILADEKEARAKSDAEREKMAKGKPTPSQKENDLAMLGESVREKADDGSGPDVPVEEMKKKYEEIAKQREAQAERPAAGGYQTRQSRAKTE